MEPVNYPRPYAWDQVIDTHCASRHDPFCVPEKDTDLEAFVSIINNNVGFIWRKYRRQQNELPHVQSMYENEISR